MIAMYVYVGPETTNEHKTLEMTDEALLWLGRAYIGEHGWRNFVHFPAFAWCMINRFMLHPGNHHWADFIYMLRRFSQPINPRWMRGGDLARKYRKSKMCSPAKLDRRERMVSLTWEELPARLRSQLVALREGRIAPPPGIVPRKNKISNFAETSKRMKKRYPHGMDLGGNWYFQGRGLKRGVVVVDHWSR